MAGQDDLKNMVMTFRVSELQMLLGFAGRNKSGRKNELQARAMDLLRLKSTPVQMKIRELYKSIQQGLINGQPIDQTGQSSANSVNNNNVPTSVHSAMMSQPMHNKQRNQMLSNMANPPSYAQYQQQPVRNTMYASGMYPSYQQPKVTPNSPLQGSYPVNPDVRFKRLPFYDINSDLIKPSSLLPHGTQRLQEASFVFCFTPHQASLIAINRELVTNGGSKFDYLMQAQLRFCLADTSCEQDDLFPAGIIVKVNGKPCQLPNPIPSNATPNKEPKRPPRPVNITPLLKLSPTVNNHLSISWAAEYGRIYSVAVFLVRRNTSAELLERLKKKGPRHADLTTGLIKEKLSEDADSDIATTSLRVSLVCPLATSRIHTPVRASTCTHLQCFDGTFYLQMNEKKATWMCPVCSKPALYDNLIIDGYFVDVLQSDRLPMDMKEIQLHQDGTWASIIVKEEQTRVLSPVPMESEEPIVSTLLDVPEPEVADKDNSIPDELKKKVIVFDLTLTDSEEDEPPPPVKTLSAIPVAPVTMNTNKSDSVQNIRQQNEASSNSMTGRLAIPSSGYMSPSVITLDSPSPPASPNTAVLPNPPPRIHTSAQPPVYTSCSNPFYDAYADTTVYQRY